MNRIFSATPSSCWKKFTALAIFGLLMLSVCSIGFAVLVSPTNEMPEQWSLVTTLDKLPASGEPKLYLLTYRSRNAWENRAPRPMGSVFLRHLPDTERVVALSAISPWMACQLKYNEEQNCFSCVGHLHEDYDLLGRRLGSHPASRDMDALDVEVRDGKIWVKPQRFLHDVATKTEIALQ